MKFQFATEDEFRGMLQNRMHQLELKFKESEHIVQLLKMQDPPDPNLDLLVAQQEELQRQLDQNYHNVETLLKKDAEVQANVNGNGSVPALT